MSFQDTKISSVDLGLPLEAQVLSQFFDQDFIPSEYINALITTTLTSQSVNNINNKSNELYPSSTMKLAFQRLSALSSHFNIYTQELTKQFDSEYAKLLNSSTQIISYNSHLSESNAPSSSNDEVITRLQYHLATLNTLMYSLLEDLKQTKEKLDSINSTDRDVGSVEELKTLVLVQKRIEEVENSFSLLKALVASSEIDDVSGPNAGNKSKNNKISIEEFKSALIVLHDLMQDQISNEIELYQKSQLSGQSIPINEKLISIIDNMINLQPIFKSLVHFQTAYATFVDFLKIQKSNYSNLFEHSK